MCEASWRLQIKIAPGNTEKFKATELCRNEKTLLYALASKRNQNRPCECVDLINVETVLQRAEYLEVAASLWILINCLSILSTFCKSVSFIFSNPPVFHILHRRLDCSWYKIQFTMACNPTKTQVSCVYVLQIQDSPRRPCTAYISLCLKSPPLGHCRFMQMGQLTPWNTSHIFTQFPAQNQGFMRNAIIRQKKTSSITNFSRTNNMCWDDQRKQSRMKCVWMWKRGVSAQTNAAHNYTHKGKINSYVHAACWRANSTASTGMRAGGHCQHKFNFIS